ALKLHQFWSTPHQVFVGTPALLEVVTSGGTGPLTYAYTGLPSSCTSENSSRLSCTPGTAGNSTVTVIVVDALGLRATIIFVLTVVETPESGPLVPGISYGVTPSCRDGVAGGSVALIGSASGGRAPYAYSWRLPTGAANGSSVNTSLAARGNSTVSLTVVDASGARVTESEQIPVAPMGCGSSAAPTGPSVPVELAWLVVGAASGALLGGLLLWRYRWRSRAGPPSTEARSKGL
ncbi:MAG: hypothetical protein L3K11_03740, partial [Thermoplasmata archaeon]|nr:hypothetical protein [Thermoplasmata archaeon]